jgi:hypothetical protein
VAQRDWDRWILASLATYLKSVAGGCTLPVLVEGLDERTPAFMQATDRAEIKITGPSSQQPSNDYFRLFVEVSVLLTSRYDGPTKNAYSIAEYAGAFHEAMNVPIGVWNFGGQPGDYVAGQPETLTFLGCLTQRPGRGDNVRVEHYGQIDKTSKIKQTLVEARYMIELEDT